MKFDYDQAWRETTKLLSANFSLLAVIAGILIFIPYAALMIALPEMGGLSQPTSAAGSEEMMAAAMAFYAEYWWALLALTIVQWIALLAMLALLRSRQSPTVGQALGAGFAAVLPYLAAALLQTAMITLIVFVLLAPGGLTGSNGLTALGVIIAMVVTAYIATKLSLLPAVMAIDGVRNPVTALTRSWLLTKGNSVRLFFFYLLLLVALIVLSMVVSMAFQLIFALLGEEAALFGTAITGALLTAGLVIAMTAILAAVHGQLSRLSARSEPAEA